MDKLTTEILAALDAGYEVRFRPEWDPVSIVVSGVDIDDAQERMNVAEKWTPRDVADRNRLGVSVNVHLGRAVETVRFELDQRDQDGEPELTPLVVDRGDPDSVPQVPGCRICSNYRAWHSETIGRAWWWQCVAGHMKRSHQLRLVCDVSTT